VTVFAPLFYVLIEKYFGRKVTKTAASSQGSTSNGGIAQ